jgi:hypothetical protein
MQLTIDVVYKKTRPNTIFLELESLQLNAKCCLSPNNELLTMRMFLSVI